MGAMPAELLVNSETWGKPSVFEAYSPWFGAVQAVSYNQSSGLYCGAVDPRGRRAVASATLLDELLARGNP